MAIIKVAEITVSSTSEPLPGNVITLQTPVVDTSATLTPRIRISRGSTSGADNIKAETDGKFNRQCG